MKRFSTLEHRYILVQFSLSSFGTLDVPEPKQNSETILTGELLEGHRSRRARIECRSKIFRYRGVLLTIRSLPPSVGLRPIHLGLTGWSHAPFVDQSFHMITIDLRPRTARTTRREGLQKGVFIDGLFLAIDPTVAKRYV
jgi:hypothetical protein